MPHYKRSRSGTTYFFTVVTYNRKPILCRKPCPDVLRSTLRNVQTNYPFSIDAMVLLPEHLHCIWTLPSDDADYSKRWGVIKKEFTKQVRHAVGAAHPTDSRKRHREAMVWQRRFWEHELRDDVDYAAHFDYIHYNPVKHGLVASPQDWPYSSFHRHVHTGVYDVAWGANASMTFARQVGSE